MKIYALKIDDLINVFPEYNAFTLSDLNEENKLPKKFLSLLNKAKKDDMLHTGYNFMLCFNLDEEGTNNQDYHLFIPDPKFNL